jgi:5-methylcytosine-specific restriction enzyme subunit McrC
MRPTQVEGLTAATVDGPQLVVCSEQGPIDVALSQVLGANGDLTVLEEVQSKGFFSVRFQGGRVRLAAGGFIGLIPLTEQTAVYVKPRAPISNLTHIVSKSGTNPVPLAVIRMYDTHDEWNAGIGVVLADALATAVTRVLAQGFLKEYAQVERVTTTPKGRVVADSKTMQLQARGITYQVNARWFERGIDTPPNRCLRRALVLASQDIPAGREFDSLRQRLNSAFHAFATVQDDPRHLFLADLSVHDPTMLPASRDAYPDALAYALAVIARHSVAHEDEGNTVALPSLVLKMDDVFEGYVRNVLQSRAADDSWLLDVLDGNSPQGRRYLFKDSSDRRFATPDAVLKRPTGDVPLVVEVKNVLDQGRFREYVDQAVTYGECYDSPNVLIVQPCRNANESGLKRIGQVGRIWVHSYRLDLAASDLEAEESRFAESVRTLAATATY